MTSNPSFRRRLIGGVALAAAVWSGQALAQEESTSVEELVVTAPNYVPTTNVSATKIDIPLIETPQSISVITRDQMDILNVQDLQEAVRYTSGVVAENFGDDARFDWLVIRGFLPVQFIDGLQAPVGSTTNVGIDLWGAQSVEILKGPAGTLYGATPPGGIVNITMRRPENDFGGEIQGQYGSFDHWQLAGDVTGPIGDGRVQARLTGLWRDYGTQTEFVQGERVFIAPALKWEITPNTQITVLAYYQNDEIDSVSSGFLPAQGTLLPNPNGPIPVERSVGEPGYNLFTREQYGIGYDFSHRFNEHLTVKQNLKYSQQDQQFISIYGAGFVDDDFNGVPDDFRTINRNNFVFPEYVRVFAVDTRAEIRGRTGQIEHTGLVGVDYRNLKNDTDFGFGAGPRLDIYAPVYGAPIPPLSFAFPFLQREDTQTGIYAQDQMALGGWRLTLTGRHDWVDTDNFGADASDDTAFTWRAGLNYLFDNGVAPYVVYATSFLPVAGADFFGTPFEPTTGRQFEAGVKWEVNTRDTKVFASAAYYHLTQENVLTDDPDPSHPFFSIQTGEVQVQGLELEAVARIRERITLNASYTYTDSEVTKASPTDPALGKELPIVARHKASAFADYTFQDGPLAGFGAGVGVRYLGPSFGDAANTPILEGEDALLVDATLHYDWRNWKIALNASNLFDEIYVQRCSDFNTCFYGIRRNVTLTLGRRF